MQEHLARAQVMKNKRKSKNKTSTTTTVAPLMALIVISGKTDEWF